MLHSSPLTLVHPHNGNLAFQLFSFDDSSHFDYLQRNNYYSLIWVMEGGGKITADFRNIRLEVMCCLPFRRISRL